MRNQLTRLSVATVASLMLVATVAGAASAAKPETTWTQDIERTDTEFTECNGTWITAEWLIQDKFTVFFNKAGDPYRDIEVITFTGQLINPDNGATVPDSGQIIYFDTLSPDFEFLTTVRNVVRKSHYIHSASREDFQTGRIVGMDNWDAGHDALCAALGA